MLQALSIRDIVLIDRLDIDFSPGLTVLTGETGAGKSILLDALSLALGGRGDASLVRHGVAQGQVTASFSVAPGHPAEAMLADSEIASAGEIILRRVQAADGRSRAFVNDQAVSIGFLGELGRRLVEIHGQHDDRALIEPAAHRALVDAFGGLNKEVASVAEAFHALKAADAAVAALAAEIAAAERERDYLSAAVAELNLLAPRPGEETELADRRRQMMQLEKVGGELAEAHEIVAGGASPIPSLAALARRLERRGAEASAVLQPIIAALDRALGALEEAETGLDAARRASAFDPKELERSEERLFALRAAARKFNVPVDELAALAGRMTDALSALESGEERLAGLKKAAAEAAAAYDRSAATLSKGRREAAKRLEKAVATELPALKLERARFLVAIASEPARRGESGIDSIAFEVVTNPGAPAGPLGKVASGGELSRFILAIKVALADRGSAPTLIFDEIDTAVGGAVSDAIGQRLARLAETVQVFSVTHAPQVAARASAHFLVAKGADGGRKGTVTRVAELDAGRRREEIARMLAGAEVTDEARAAAERLIAGASSS